MGSAAVRILVEALKLTRDERTRIVVELLASLVPDVSSQQRSESHWIREIERRARVAVAGGPGLSWSEARARIESQLSTP